MNPGRGGHSGYRPIIHATPGGSTRNTKPAGRYTLKKRTVSVLRNSRARRSGDYLLNEFDVHGVVVPATGGRRMLSVRDATSARTARMADPELYE